VDERCPGAPVAPHPSGGELTRGRQMDPVRRVWYKGSHANWMKRISSRNPPGGPTMNVACNSKVSIHAVMRRLSTKQQPNFPVVLFRSDFMLLSEKNCMKVCENQWVLTIPYPPKYLSRATSRGQTMVPEAQKPSQWLCLTKLPREMCSQLIASKALSWGTIRKSACILAEIIIRKSQGFD